MVSQDVRPLPTCTGGSHRLEQMGVGGHRAAALDQAMHFPRPETDVLYKQTMQPELHASSAGLENDIGLADSGDIVADS